MDQNHLNNFERGPTNDHSCEVWSKSNQWFKRCRLKKLFTDGRTHGRMTDKMWSQKLILSLRDRRAKKKVKVNPRSFFQTLLGPCPQCCIPSPRGICPLISEKIFKVCLPLMVAILVMWPRCSKQILGPTTCWGLHVKFVFDWPSGFCEDVCRVFPI